MAGGMAAIVALTDLDLCHPMAQNDSMLIDKYESVEIKALAEDKCREATDILEERHIQSQPLKAHGMALANMLMGKEPQEKEMRRRKSEENLTPLMRVLTTFMPIFTWLPRLSLAGLRGDMIAGITVGVMVIPQSMSYGSIAGLPYINGMYSACVPTFVYALFGQGRQLAVGPVAMVSLLVEAGLRGKLSEEDCPAWYAQGGENGEQTQYELCPEAYVRLACMTAMITGVVLIVGSVLKLGFLVTFLGHPVSSGFTSAAAIIIGLSQFKYMLGYEIPKSQFIYVTVYNIFKDLDKLKFMPFLLGIVFLAFLYGNKKFAQKNKRFTLLGPMGPLITCVIGTVMIWAFPVLGTKFYVKYVGYIPDGLMPLSVESWRLSDVNKVMPTVISSCLIGFMESIAISKMQASKNGYEIEAGQEMLALGLSNFVGSAFSCYPVTGSFSRSAVNNTTGASSQFSGIVTAVVMLLTLMFLTPLFYYLPKFVLAAIVMNSVMALVDLKEARHLLVVKKHDFVLWVVAFLGTLFLGVLMGILVAVALSLVIVIYESVRPQITILWRIPGTTIYRNMKQESNGAFIPNVFICRIGSSMYFANTSFVKEMLLGFAADLELVNPTEYIILEMTPVMSIDSTACNAIQDIVAGFRAKNINVAFAMVGTNVEETMRKANLKKFIGEKWFFVHVHDAVQFCLKHQHAKRRIQDKGGVLASASGLDLGSIDVGFSNEIGFSNEMDSENTVVFLTLAIDDPEFWQETSKIFKKNNIEAPRCQMERLGEEGAKHTYILKSQKTQGKLTDREIDRVREDLERLIKSQTRTMSSPPPRRIGRALEEGSPDSVKGEEQRLTALEDQLRELQSSQGSKRRSNDPTCCSSGSKAKLCGLMR